MEPRFSSETAGNVTKRQQKLDFLTEFCSFSTVPEMDADSDAEFVGRLRPRMTF